MKAALLALTLVLGTQGASAQGTAPDTAAVKGIKAEVEKCMAKDSSTYGMRMCMSDGFERADNELNRVYKAIVATLTKQAEQDKKDGLPESAGSGEILIRLRAAQRAWIPFRDAQVAYEATSMLGGTGEGVMYDSAMLEMTYQRINDLSSDETQK